MKNEMIEDLMMPLEVILENISEEGDEADLKEAMGFLEKDLERAIDFLRKNLEGELSPTPIKDERFVDAGWDFSSERFVALDCQVRATVRDGAAIAWFRRKWDCAAFVAMLKLEEREREERERDEEEREEYNRLTVLAAHSVSGEV